MCLWPLAAAQPSLKIIAAFSSESAKSWAHCMCLFVSFNRSGRLLPQSLLNHKWMSKEKHVYRRARFTNNTEEHANPGNLDSGILSQPLSRLSYGILVLPQICSFSFPHSPPASEQAFSDPLLTSRSNWDGDWILRLIVWPVSHPPRTLSFCNDSWRSRAETSLVRIKAHLQTSARPIRERRVQQKRSYKRSRKA